MTLPEFKQQYCFPQVQAVIFTGDGNILDSCETLFSVKNNNEKSIFEAFPLLDGVRATLLSLSPLSTDKVHLPRVELVLDDQFLIVDMTVSSVWYQGGVAYLWIIQNLTEQYNYLFIVQQERNESIIEGQKLRTENEILDLHKDIDILNKLRKSRKELNISVSSELEMPLNKIMALTAKLKDAAQTPQQEQYLRTIERAIALIDDQITQTRPAQLDLFLVPPDRTDIDLTNLIWSVIKIYNLNHLIKNHPFYLHVKPNFPALVVGNKPRIAQLLHNFIYHAFFTYKGSSTTLTASVIDAKSTHCRICLSMTCVPMAGLSESELKEMGVQITDDIAALAFSLKGDFELFTLPNQKSILMQLIIPFRLPQEDQIDFTTL